MKLLSDISPANRLILAKQLEMVGADPLTFDFDQPDWYCLYTWSEAQENEFREWLDAELRTNKILRKIAPIAARNKAYRKAEIEWWLLMYGWKTNG